MNIDYLYPRLNNKVLKELLQITSNESQISRMILEKDLYMTGILMKFIHSLSEPEKVYFKGGTSMSKCHKILERFSEDCDLFVYTGNSNATRTQESTLNKKITHSLVDLFNDDLAKTADGLELSQRGGDYNKICLTYERTFPNEDFKPHVEFEISSCPLRNKKGYYLNSQTLPIQPLVGEILYKTGRKDIADDLGLTTDSIQCTTPHKTICDKISRLIRVSYDENIEKQIQKYIRDFYDLTMILKTGNFNVYIESNTFLQEMLRTNIEDSMRNNSHSEELFGKAPVFAQPETMLAKKQIRETYKRTTENFCFNPQKAPTIDEVISTMKSLQPYLLKFDDYKAKMSQPQNGQQVKETKPIQQIKPD